MIRKYIPDFITSLNLLCGVIGIVLAFKGRFDWAFYAMLAGAVFDFCDGLAARALDAYSPMGKELDSLADVVTFGALPSLMLFNLMKACSFTESIWCWIPLVIAVFSGLRLAKFNVDERQHNSFIGLPTPACAMICGSLCSFVAFQPDCFLCAWVAGPVFIPVLSVVLSALLVCELPMFSMKFSSKDAPVLKRKRLFFVINCVICAAVVAITGQNWTLAVLLSFVVYIVMNAAFAIFKI